PDGPRKRGQSWAANVPRIRPQKTKTGESFMVVTPRRMTKSAPGVSILARLPLLSTVRTTARASVWRHKIPRPPFRISSAAISSAQLPQSVPITVRRVRAPKKNLPQTKAERDQILGIIRQYVDSAKLVPPMPLDELRVHAEKLIADHDLD